MPTRLSPWLPSPWRPGLPVLRLLLLLALVCVLAACASTAKRVAVPYQVEIVADDDINPDINGRPSPVQVVMHELRSSHTFDTQDFFSLRDNPQEALGKELLHTEQFVLRPGGSHTFTRTGELDAQLLGVVVAFRDLDGSQWRLSVPLPEPQNTNIYKVWQFSPNEEKLLLRVTRQGLTIESRSRSWWPKLF